MIGISDLYKEVEIDGGNYRVYAVFNNDAEHAQALYDELLTIYENVVWQKNNTTWDIIYTPIPKLINTIEDIKETRTNKRLE